jgi:hypothetical protein
VVLVGQVGCRAGLSRARGTPELLLK